MGGVAGNRARPRRSRISRRLAGPLRLRADRPRRHRPVAHAARVAAPAASRRAVQLRLALAEPQDEHGPEYIAIVPLLAIAATSVAAVIDASLSVGVTGETLDELIPAVVLAGAAILMTSERPVPSLREPPVKAWLLVFALIVAATLIVVLLREERLAAVLGYVAALYMIGYALLLFHPIERAETLTRACQSMLSLPDRRGTGAAVFLRRALGRHAPASATLGTSLWSASRSHSSSRVCSLRRPAAASATARLASSGGSGWSSFRSSRSSSSPGSGRRHRLARHPPRGAPRRPPVGWRHRTA